MFFQPQIYEYSIAQASGPGQALRQVLYHNHVQLVISHYKLQQF